MIMLCERCFSEIHESEPVIRLAHISHVVAGGDVKWNHTYLHTSACTAPRPAPHQQPDVGAWDPARGIGGFRQ